jgi:TP901 family phage tail tape measure protein
MQALLASLVVGMTVEDAAYKASMATARAEAKKTGQEFDRSGDQMGAAIERAAQAVNRAAIGIVDSLARVGNEVRNAGAALTIGMTLPLGGLAKVSKDAASTFQSAMGKLNAAMVNATPEQLTKLRDAALALGPAMGKSAVEAAGAMEALAKAGMSVESILGGGLQSALTLGAVGQAELASSAALTTDIVQQFGKSASELPTVVNKITGALDKSKLGFDDYRLALGSAGGAAAGMGVSFEDMNVALASTASYFSSGQDAGTSFKTFLTTLVPASKDAARVQEMLKLSFFDAGGQMKSVGAIADELNTKMSNLSDRSKTDALTTMFGTDGMRTAIALMKQGRDGIEATRASIDKVTADQKLKILLDGEAAATQRLATAWEKLKIAIGEAGILQLVTSIKDGFATMIGAIASAPPWFMKTIVAVGALAAAVGPLILVVSTLAKIALPLLLLRLGPLATGFAVLINPVGVLIRMLGQLALQAGVATVIGRLGTAMLGFAGPIGLAITALAILVPMIYRSGEASTASAKALAAANEQQAQGADIALRLATATGKAKDEALAAARAFRTQAAAAFYAAKGTFTKARADLAAAKSRDAIQRQAGAGWKVGTPPGTDRPNAGATGRQDELASLNAASAALETAMKTLGEIDSAIAGAAGAGSSPKVDMNFDAAKIDRKTREPKGRDVARDQSQFQDELGRARVDLLRAQADLLDSAEARYKADMAALEEERASYARQLQLDEGLTDAKRAQLLAAKDLVLYQQQGAAERARFVALAQRDYDLAQAENELAQDRVRDQIALADSVKERRDGELRLLELQRAQEEADLELILATRATSSAEWQVAADRKKQLDKIYAARSTAIERANEGPGDTFMRSLDKSADRINEDIEEIGVSALKELNTELADAILGTGSLADAFANMGKRIIASLVEIAVQQSIIKPLANSLFGSEQGGEGGGGFLGRLLGRGTSGANIVAGDQQPFEMVKPTFGGAGGGLFGVLGALGRVFGGGRRLGGGVRAGKFYEVGEAGPELFAPGVSGTIIPNGGRGDGRRGPSIVQLVVGEGQMFEPRVQAISGNVSIQTMQASNRMVATRGRQALG